MRERTRTRELSLCIGGIVLAALAITKNAGAQTVTGNLSTTGVNYGSNVPGTGALATQSINTGFGDSTYMGNDANGSELDAAYGVISSNTLYVFLAGDYQNNGNKVNIFIDSGASSGQSTLNVSSGYASSMTGSQFSPGFAANVQLDVNDSGGTMYVDRYDLTSTAAAQDSYQGQIALTNGIGSGTLSGITYALNNTNTGGVTQDGAGGAANAAAAQAVNTGLELAIPLSSIGYSAGNILVLADINNGGDSYLSNQFLPGLPVGTGNLGTGTFNFSATAGQYFTIAAPANVPNGNWIQPNSGSWTTTTNWSNGYVPNVAKDTANFSGATASSTVTLGGSHTVGSLSFDSTSFSYTLTGGALTLDNGTSTASVIAYSGSHFISSPVTLNSNTMVSAVDPGQTIGISGNITGVGSLTVDNPGNGVVQLSGTNSYGGGTTVIAGNLQLDSAGALPGGSALTLNAQDVPAGVLDLNGINANVSSISVLTGPQTIPTGAVAQIINTSATAATATLTYAGSNSNPSTFNGNINDNSGSGGGTTALTVTSGSLTLAGNSSYVGNTTVNSGATLTLSSANGKTLPNGGNVINNGSLVVNDTLDGRTIGNNTADVAGNISGSGTTTVNSAMALTAINFSQAAGLVNNGTVTVLGTGTVGPISGAGTLNVNGALKLATSSGVSQMASLSVAGTGTFDVSNNHVFINYGSGTDPISSIAALLATGYASGDWDGTGGIITSAPLVVGGLTYGLGYADGADPQSMATGLASGTIEIKYTLLGDADLNGIVNGIDFGILAANFNKGITGWDEGDFDYNNIVNGLDFGDLAANFNKGAAGTAATDALDAFAAANGLLADVPEPASLGLLALGACGIMNRCRRK